MSTSITIDELRSAMWQFQGSRCWNVCTCECAQSLRLSFGKAVESRVYNQSLKKRYDGQYELFVLCSWRLDSPDSRICGAGCDHDKIKQTASCLIGDTFESIEIIPPFCDATVHFRSGKKLRIFCDYFDKDGSNWFCSDKESWYDAGNAGSENQPRQGERFDLVSDVLHDPEQIDWQFVISDSLPGALGCYIPENGESDDQPEEK